MLDRPLRVDLGLIAAAHHFTKTDDASVCLGQQATPVHASKLAEFAANQGKSGGAEPAAGATQPLHLGLFSHLKGIVDLNPEVPHCAFQFRVT
jgi:hypothetical protein